MIWVPHSPSFLPSLEATSRGVSGATHHGPLPLPLRGCRCTSVSTTAACDLSLNYHRNPVSLDTATASRVGRQLKWIQSKFQTSCLNLCERTSSSLCPGNLRLAWGDGQLWGPWPERCSVRQSSAPGSRADGRTDDFWVKNHSFQEPALSHELPRWPEWLFIITTWNEKILDWYQWRMIQNFPWLMSPSHRAFSSPYRFKKCFRKHKN